MTPEEVAREYFRRMAAGDSAVVELFADDAQLLGFGNRVIGKATIAEFYGRAQSDAAPKPEIATIAAVGNRVLGEVRVALDDGTTMHVVDIFEVEGDMIKSLTYFNSEYPPLTAG